MSLLRTVLSGLAPPVPIDDTCVLYMPFEDNAGTFCEDQSQYANHGTTVGATQCNGVSGLGISCDGIDDYVAVADSASLDCSALTIAAWVKLNPAWDAGAYILAKCEDRAAGGEYSYGLRLENTRRVYLDVSVDGNAPASQEGSTEAVSVGIWHHLVATFEETIPPAAGTYLIYVDGGVVASIGGAEPSIHLGTGRVIIAGRWDTTTGEVISEFYGLLDDVMVFNRALSAQEIYDLWSVHAGDNTRE